MKQQFDYPYWLSRVVNKYGSHWELTDPAHRQDHFDDVYEQGLLINDKLNLGYDTKLIFVAAYFHDLFAAFREVHHTLSYEFIKETDCEIITELLGEVGSSNRVMVSDACHEHRASFKGEYTCMFSDLIASADRGGIPNVVLRITEIVKRAYLYTKDKNPNTGLEVVCVNVLTHLKDKYSSHGYSKLPLCYEVYYKDKIDLVKRMIDKLTLNDVILIVNAIELKKPKIGE